jgi:hypothetical protein
VTSVFRERAIAAQSGTNALDERIRVVPVRAWIALSLALVILVGGALWLFAGRIVVMASGPGVVVNAPGNLLVTSPIDGTLVRTDVAIGARIVAGDVLAVIVTGAGDAEVPVASAVSGVVVAVGPGPGANVAFGEELAVIAPDSDQQVAYAFVPAVDGAQIRPGMRAWMLPDDVDPTEVGYLRGEVAAVSPLPVPTSRIGYVLANRALADQVAAQGPVLEVLITLEADASTPTGLVWTQPPGLLRPIVSGTPGTASIAVAELPPYRAFYDG